MRRQIKRGGLCGTVLNIVVDGEPSTSKSESVVPIELGTGVEYPLFIEGIALVYVVKIP